MSTEPDRSARDHEDESLIQRVEHGLEHAAEAIRDRARAAELGLLQGDHSVIGELSGVVAEVAHPEGEEKPGPEHQHRT